MPWGGEQKLNYCLPRTWIFLDEWRNQSAVQSIIILHVSYKMAYTCILGELNGGLAVNGGKKKSRAGEWPFHGDNSFSVQSNIFQISCYS